MTLNKFGVPISTDNDDRFPTIQPKFKNRFRIFFYNFAHQDATINSDPANGILQLDRNSFALMGNVVSFNKPTVTFGQSEVRSFVGKGNVVGRPTWENLNLTLRDDVKNAVIGFVTRQVYLQQQKYMPHSPGFGRNYTFSIMLEVMDGRVGHVGLERWLFSGCSIHTSNFGDVSYEMDTEIQKIDLSIMFNNILVYSPDKINLHNHHGYNENSTGGGDFLNGAANDMTGTGGGGGGFLGELANDVFGGVANEVQSIFGKATTALTGAVDRGIDAAGNAISSRLPF